MTSNFDDQLRNRLDALNTDVANIRMAGPDAARRRAAQRTRNQITGTALAGVTAIIIGIVGVTQGDPFTAPEPANTETPTAVPSPPDEPGPTATPDDTETPDGTDDATPPDGEPSPEGANIPADAFLTVEDITSDGVAAPEWEPGDSRQVPFDCAPSAPEEAAYRYYDAAANRHFLQFIEATDEPAARFSDLRDDLEQCIQEVELSGNEPVTGFTQIWNVDGLGDEAWMANYFDQLDEPIGYAEAYLVSVRMMREGNHVTVVIHGGPAQDDNTNMETERSELAAQRLCAAFGTECTGDVTPRRLDREPVGDIAGWLTVEDVTSIPGYEDVVEGAEPIDPSGNGQSGWPLHNLVVDPVAAGATSMLTRAYVPEEPTDQPLLHQSVARFPDDQAARAHYDELVTAANEFEQEGDEVTNTGSVDGDDFSLTTWRSETPAYGTVFVYGAVVQGNTVSVVSTNFGENEGRDLTADQLTELLIRAAEHMREAQQGS